MEIINLMPLSQGEIAGTQYLFIDAIFSAKNFKNPQTFLTKQSLFEKMYTGGYPSVQHIDEEACQAWLRSYVNLLLQKDIKDLAQIKKLTQLPNLLKILAARASGLLNVAELSRESKLTAKTSHRYLALLETIFIINTQPAWITNLFCDLPNRQNRILSIPGLLMYLLGINVQRAATENILMGKISENFVVSELKKQATWYATTVQLYHFL